LLWSFWALFAIGTRASRGFATSYVFEYFWLFIIWVMGLVGAAIATHYWHGNLSFCRPFNNQCRVLTAIVAWSWINWAFITFIMLATCATQLGGEGVMSPLHGRDTTETRNMEGGGSVSVPQT